jgi:hypothetical protein
MHCACAALSDAAAELSTGQAERIAQNPQQRHSRNYIHRLRFSVENKLDSCHKFSVQPVSFRIISD